MRHDILSRSFTPSLFVICQFNPIPSFPLHPFPSRRLPPITVTLSKRAHKRARESILIRAYTQLDRDAALGRVRHLDERRDASARDGLAVEFERVRSRGQGDVGSF